MVDIILPPNTNPYDVSVLIYRPFKRRTTGRFCRTSDGIGYVAPGTVICVGQEYAIVGIDGHCSFVDEYTAKRRVLLLFARSLRERAYKQYLYIKDFCKNDPGLVASAELAFYNAAEMVRRAEHAANAFEHLKKVQSFIADALEQEQILNEKLSQYSKQQEVANAVPRR